MNKINKDFKQMLANEINVRREAGLTLNEIEQEMRLKYPSIKSFDNYRILADNIRDYKIKQINESNEYLNIARARDRLLIQRKILVKERNDLNNKANIEAFRELIIETIKKHSFNNPIKLNVNPIQVDKDYCRTIYIISDEHYKGDIDNNHLIDIYKTIKNDIKINHIKECEFWYLGDGIDGLIHTGSLASNDGAILPTINYCNIVIGCINQIKQVKSVKYVNKSNHTQTRPLNSSRNELAREDLGFVIAELFKKGLRKDIEFISNDIITFDYKGHSVALLHGHQPYAKSKAKMIEYWSSKYHFVPDLIYMGHYHTFKVNEFGINKFLCVAPTSKQFNGDYENECGYISNNAIVKFKWNDYAPKWTLLNINGKGGE